MSVPDIAKLHSALTPIVDRLDKISGENIGVFHDLAILLAELGYDIHEAWQIEAMDVARTIWTPHFDQDRWGDVIQIAVRNLEKSEKPSSRLVWCALNRNTILDSFGAEYLIDKAFEAGVSAKDIFGIFNKVLADK